MKARSFTTFELALFRRAFQRAWKRSLRDERVTAANIEKVPLVLLKGIAAAMSRGERNETQLMHAALDAVYQQETHWLGKMPIASTRH